MVYPNCKTLGQFAFPLKQFVSPFKQCVSPLMQRVSPLKQSCRNLKKQRSDYSKPCSDYSKITGYIRMVLIGSAMRVCVSQKSRNCFYFFKLLKKSSKSYRTRVFKKSHTEDPARITCKNSALTTINAFSRNHAKF